MTWRVASSVCLVLAMTPVTACVGAAEYAEVQVDGTDEVRRTAASLELLVIAQPERRLVLNERLDLPADGELPLELVLAPDRGGEDRFHVIARAYDGPGGSGSLVARQLLLGGFSPGDIVHYRMVLQPEGEP